MRLTPEQRQKARKANRGRVWYALQRMSSPLSRYSTVISEKSAVMSEFGGLHGNCRYFSSAEKNSWVRLQVVEANPSFIKIDASLVPIKEARSNAEALGFAAMFGRKPNSIVGVVSSVDEIDAFLDAVWEKWVWRDDANLGSSWTRTPDGYRRNSDGRVFELKRVKRDNLGWYTIEDGDSVIVFGEDKLVD